MGMMLAAYCRCGYKNEALAAGAGMRTFTEHCEAPCLCAACHEVVTVDLMDSGQPCPVCGAHAIAYDDLTLGGAETESELYPVVEWNLFDGRTFTLHSGSRYRCPGCSSDTMAFEVLGHFD